VHVYAAGFGDASLVFIVFVYVYVVIVNKHLTFLWITWIFVYGSRGCGIDNPAEHVRTGRRSQGKLLAGLARSSVYQSFAHNVSGGLYKSCPEGVVDKWAVRRSSSIVVKMDDLCGPDDIYVKLCRERLIRTANALTTVRRVAYLRLAGRLVKLAKVQAVVVPGTTGLPRGSE
jgi:hypothetical protein